MFDSVVNSVVTVCDSEVTVCDSVQQVQIEWFRIEGPFQSVDSV